MKILNDYLDDELFIEIALTQHDCLAIMSGELLMQEEPFYGRVFNVSVRLDQEEENATY